MGPQGRHALSVFCSDQSASLIGINAVLITFVARGQPLRRHSLSRQIIDVATADAPIAKVIFACLNDAAIVEFRSLPATLLT